LKERVERTKSVIPNPLADEESQKTSGLLDPSPAFGGLGVTAFAVFTVCEFGNRLPLHIGEDFSISPPK